MQEPSAWPGKFVAPIVGLPVLVAAVAALGGAVYACFLQEAVIDHEFKRRVNLVGLRGWALECLQTARDGPLDGSEYPEHLLPGAVRMASITPGEPWGMITLRIDGGEFPSGDLVLCASESAPTPGARRLIDGVWRVPRKGR